MVGCLLAYAADGSIVGTLDWVVARNDAGEPVGVVDFAAHEAAGGAHTDIWVVEGAAGSKAWPEWLGAVAYDFRVELEGPPGHKRIAALVHRTSGRRRERATLEARIAERVAEAQGGPVDLRDIVGGPDRALLLDDKGDVRPRQRPVVPDLPLVGIRT